MSTPPSSVTVLTSSSTAESVDEHRTEPLSTLPGTTAVATSTPRQGRAGRTRTGTPNTVAWICWLFVLNFLTQRLSLPGISIPFSVPISVIWLYFAWQRGVLAVEMRRTFLWLLAAGAGALVVLGQLTFDKTPYISVNSWAFWMVIWLPACFMVADRSREIYDRTLAAVADIGVWLGALSAAFLGLQFVGLPYKDYLASVVPSAFLVSGFNTSYPLVYGSPIYKSNGWLALEPSFMSFTLGICIVAGLLSSARVWKIAVMGLGMAATVGGSGFAIVLVSVLIMALSKQRVLLRRYVIPGLVIAAVTVPTVVGQTLLGRVTEGKSANSSTMLRSVEPYLYLWPRWVDDWAKVVFGGGAGSSRMVVDGSGVDGLLVPTVGKIFYDYGIFAGAVLLALFLSCYLRTPEPALGLSVLASMLIMQPPAQPLMVPAFLLTTLWAPAYLSNRLAGTDPDSPPPPRRRSRADVRKNRRATDRAIAAQTHAASLEVSK